MTNILEQQFCASFANQTMVDCLAANTSFSKQQLKRFMQQGAVWLQTEKQDKPSRVRRAKKTLEMTDKIFFNFNEKVLNIKITPPKLVADEVGFSVWYKPKGVLCQGSKWTDHTTINRWIENEYKFNGQSRPAIIVHRLDKATDGLILIAHNNKMVKLLTQAFSSRLITKIYQATVTGYFKDALTLDEKIDDKTAISHITPINYNQKNNTTQLKVQIETGRKHQIRRHLSQAGYAIIGDRLYGNADESSPDLQLTAVYLAMELDNVAYKFSLPDFAK